MTQSPRPVPARDRLILEVVRTRAENAVQVSLSQVDENGVGFGYRLAGSKHYNQGVTTLLEEELTERDASNIRGMLDAAFPVAAPIEIEGRTEEFQVGEGWYPPEEVANLRARLAELENERDEALGRLDITRARIQAAEYGAHAARETRNRVSSKLYGLRARVTELEHRDEVLQRVLNEERARHTTTKHLRDSDRAHITELRARVAELEESNPMNREHAPEPVLEIHEFHNHRPDGTTCSLIDCTVRQRPQPAHLAGQAPRLLWHSHTADESCPCGYDGEPLSDQALDEVYRGLLEAETVAIAQLRGQIAALQAQLEMHQFKAGVYAGLSGGTGEARS